MRMSVASRITSGALVFLLFVSCAHKVIHKDLTDEKLLFPDGRYFHHVYLTLSPSVSMPKKKFDFDGILEIKPETIKLIGLSPLGTSLLRITEDRKTGKVDIDVFFPVLKKLQNSILEYYSVVQMMIKTSRNPRSTELKIPLAKETAVLQFETFDKNHFPEKIVVQHPKFSLIIEMRGYEI